MSECVRGCVSVFLLIQVDFHRSQDALEKNQAMEFERNRERFQFLKVHVHVHNYMYTMYMFIYVYM